jgi:putative MATE family efflux protein
MKKSRLEEFIGSPKKSLILISLPVIASSLVETLYNLTDTIFVGRLGSDALAAMTFSWPFFFVLVALSLGINAGISSVVSRAIGAKNKKQAENACIHGLILAFIAAILIALIGLPLLRPLFRLSGASGSVLQMATSYMAIILVGVVFMFLSYTMTSIFASQGDTKTAMKIDVYSLVLNIILTPILIFGFHMGIRGAALGTTLSVLFATVQGAYYLKKVSYLKLKRSSFRYSFPTIKEIIKIGFPASLMMLVISIYVIFLNRAMAHFSVSHVAAFGVVSRLESVSILPIYGLSVGALTLAGMFYGAKKYELLKTISNYSILISMVITTVIGLVFFIFARLLIRVFTPDLSVIGLGAPYMRLDVFTFPTMAATMIVSRIMQAMGKGMPGLIINIIRVFVLAVPLSYLFVFVLGYGYLFIALSMIIGGIVAALIGFIWLKCVISASINKDKTCIFQNKK